MALSEAHLGHWEKAREHLVSALNYKTESKLNLIDRALQSTLVSHKHSILPPPRPPEAFHRYDTISDTTTTTLAAELSDIQNRQQLL